MTHGIICTLESSELELAVGDQVLKEAGVTKLSEILTSSATDSVAKSGLYNLVLIPPDQNIKAVVSSVENFLAGIDGKIFSAQFLNIL